MQPNLENQILAKATNAKNKSQIKQITESVKLLLADISLTRLEAGNSNGTKNITLQEIEAMDLSEYNLKVSEEDGLITFQSTSMSIDESVKLQIDKDGNIIEQTATNEAEENEEETTVEIKFIFNNNVNFVNNATIEDFNEENTLNLDTLEEEQRNTLMQAIEQRLQDVNAEKMEQLGLKADENPLQNLISSSGVYSNSLNTLDAENDDMSKMEIASFNSKFEMYGGTNIRGTTVRGLISIIASNNGLDDEEDEENGSSNESLFSNNNENSNLIKEIHFDGSEYEVNKQNITLIKSSIETESYYRVEFEKEESTGRIYRVVINKK